MRSVHKINICGYSDVGRTRTRNEDAFLIGSIVERAGIVNVSLEMEGTAIKEQGILAAVADGMGGMGSGDVASFLGLQAFSKHFYSKIYVNASPDELTELLRQSVMCAHDRVSEASNKGGNAARMGTTLVGMAIYNGVFYRYHVGDSRLYRFRDDQLLQLTKDHSLVQMLVDSGKLSEEEAESHSRKNEITNSIGGGAACKPEIVKLTLNEGRPGDCFLLCSDGLSNMLDHQETDADFDALIQLMIQAETKEKDLEQIKKRLNAGNFFDFMEPVLQGIDRALSAKPDHISFQQEYMDICKGISQIHSNWQGWQQVLSIFLAEQAKNPIVEILSQPISTEEKVISLINAANEKNSQDNVTVVLIELS